MRERRAVNPAAACRSAARPRRNRWRPPLATFERLLKSTGRGRDQVATTMAFVRVQHGAAQRQGLRVVPIVADEARTFGMEGLFRQIGIYNPGQKYKPVDADQLMYYREGRRGQMLEEGITECGAFRRGWRGD